MNRKLFPLICFALAVTTASLVSLARPIRGASAASSEEFPASDLPYDAEVEYIEQNGSGSTGYPNLDTGFPMSAIRHLSIVCDWSDYSSREFIGGGLSGSYLIEVSVDGYYGLGYNNYSPFHVSGIDELDWFYTQGARPQLFVNGFLGCTDTLVRVPTGTLQTCLRKTNAPHFKLYRLTIYTDGGEIGQDLIPVRFTNEFGLTEGAMYDRVSKTLFRNAGSGYFVIGPDKE